MILAYSFPLSFKLERKRNRNAFQSYDIKNSKSIYKAIEK